MTKNKIFTLDDSIEAYKTEVAVALSEQRLPLPIYIGEHGKPQAVIVSALLMDELLGHLEDAVEAPILAARVAAGNARPLDQLAEELGLSKSDFQ